MLPGLAQERDGKAAHELYELRLTERLSSARLEVLKTKLRKTKAKAALVALADQSAFENLPKDEIPDVPAPDTAEQRHIVRLAFDYLSGAVPRLPNLYATRVTARYDDTSQDPILPAGTYVVGGLIHQAGSSKSIVVYRDHKEVLDSGKKRRSYEEDKGLVTRGTFGPILFVVMGDAARSGVTFSRWEQGVSGLEAVFRFSVTKDKSHYEVAYRRVSDNTSMTNLERPTRYHGEVALDAATGTIMRLTVMADLEPDAELLKADVMVEYASVEIAGKSYICPVRSVALSQGRVMSAGRSRPGAVKISAAVTRLNDVVFSDYHVFRTEMRVITDDTPETGQKP
jgi:hypothetical protein